MKSLYLMRCYFLKFGHFTVNLERYCSQSAAFSSDKVVSTQQMESSRSFIVSSSLSEEYFPRRLPLTAEEYERRKMLPPVQPENPHLLKVALVGEPNVGKSTLINSLVKWKVCAVSKKVHTTRNKSSAVIVEGNKQVVFLDTPGFVTPEHSKRHNLEVSLVVDPKRSAESADLIAVVIDAANKWTNKSISPSILQMLENLREKTSILLLNKVDAVKSKSELLHITSTLTKHAIHIEKEDQGNEEEIFINKNEFILQEKNEEIQTVCPLPPKFFPDLKSVRSGWPHFSRVFMISALQRDGIDQLRECLFSMARPAPWMYHSSNVTDQHPYHIVKQIIREKLLDFLPKEIPYGLALKITSWILDPAGVLRIMVVIKCPKTRHKRFVIGPSGSHISSCVQNSRQAIADAFRCEVLLKIEVK